MKKNARALKGKVKGVTDEIINNSMDSIQSSKILLELRCQDENR